MTKRLTDHHYYLSGPMTGYDHYNFPAFNDAASKLAHAGYMVINPAKLPEPPKAEWTEYMRRDIAMMMEQCDAVAVLPGWEKSQGACLEVNIAHRLGWPVKQVGELLDAALVSSPAA